VGTKVQPRPRWFLVPFRVLLMTILFTLLAFAVSLLLGLMGTLVWGALSGTRTNLAVAYRAFAAPVAALVAIVALVINGILEVRHYRQAKALAAIERAG
jgi:multisubunit Na+/H+ antiporter MnhC subunit